VKKGRYFILIMLTLMLTLNNQVSAEESTDNSENIQTKETQEAPVVSVKAYYFHSTRRCKTCLTIESNAKEALETGFAEEYAQGIITWNAIDIDREENKHFEKDFDLAFSSLILVKYINGKQVEWKNLQKVWELVWDEADFMKYVKTEAQAYLEM